jgi:orotidine-5'-phosphate decarboxylase
MTFQEKLDRIVKKNNSLVCVGLDSDFTKFPSHFNREKNPIFRFNQTIIESTHNFVCAYKPNLAFYEAGGVEGITQLKMTFDFLRQEHPQIVTILDAKRADIGSTNEGYVKFVFDYLGADGITVHPYLGQEALKPFLERTDKGIFVLCRTSNPGAGEFQDLLVDGIPLYQIVAHHVIEKWNVNGNCMLVVGATYPQELAEVRKIVGDMTLLVPGVGAQGADIEKTVKAGLNSKKAGMIVNSSRGIIFTRYPKEETEKLRGKINKYRRC